MSVSVLEEMVPSQAAMQKVSKSNLHVMQEVITFIVSHLVAM